jgi:hypothetical protein
VNNSELKKVIPANLFKIESSKLNVVVWDEKMKMSVEQCPVFLVMSEPSMNKL